jgi:hypothetical protein
MKLVLIIILRFYQLFISSALPFNHCRFYPSCSDYSIEAIEKRGVMKGLWLTFRRLSKCHPYSSAHGYDPVP